MTRVISAPQGLKWATAAVFLTAPIAAVQAVVMARAPWWALPWKSMEVASLWAFGISFVLSIFLLRARRSLYAVLIGVGILWVVLSAMAAIRTQNPSMGFFTIFLGVFFGLLTSWVKHEFGRSFFDPSVKWFEGAPRSIPALDCQIQMIKAAKSEREPVRFKVSRLDEEGAFLFLLEALGRDFPVQLAGKKTYELFFRFHDREVRCQGMPMLLFKRNAEGVGFRFEGNTPDENKELGDFIETLRGEGYV